MLRFASILWQHLPTEFRSEFHQLSTITSCFVDSPIMGWWFHR